MSASAILPPRPRTAPPVLQIAARTRAPARLPARSAAQTVGPAQRPAIGPQRAELAGATHAALRSILRSIGTPPPADLCWQRYVEHISNAAVLPPVPQARALSHLIEDFEHLPEGACRLAAISHLLLTVRAEPEPFSVRHLAALAARLPLLAPPARAMQLFQCIGEIAQLTSDSGRSKVLTALAQCLPHLPRQAGLKQGVLLISRFAAASHAAVQRAATTAIETALLGICAEIRQGVTQADRCYAAVGDFSGLLDCWRIVPAPTRAALMDATVEIVAHAGRAGSAAFTPMREACHRMGPQFVDALALRLAQ